MDETITEIDKQQLNLVSGANTCTNAFELSYGIIGGSLGFIFGPAGGMAGFSAGYSAGSILAELACDKGNESDE
ncbi:hypothetical protein [Alteromonas flava]|uniref:hypothetical protein n=1 Tax=Alteromonas flava TaxID=2048003 RepID=UPI000C282D58|nr:hypothetical protein [Alteromonas flava]